MTTNSLDSELQAKMSAKGNQNPSPPSNVIFYIGLSLTIVWLALVLIWWKNDAADVRSLSPNEFGDFLGGTFAPIAFLWLVLGFWQQGRELRNSAETLWLQMEELRNSVEQQRDLVSATRDLRETEMKIAEAREKEEHWIAQPVLKIEAAGGSTSVRDEGYKFRFSLTNSGHGCNDLRVTVENLDVLASGRFESGAEKFFHIVAPFAEKRTHLCEVRWIDGRNREGLANYRITTHRDERYVERVEQVN